MAEYQREYPLFSLCGLNCGLCPRYQTEGSSKCPGCGGKDFSQKHPSCKVINCSKKHGQFEYCFQCPSYPCEKYLAPYTTDSFITYANVKHDLEKAQVNGLAAYQAELDEKIQILEYLILRFNDGRRKTFYCTAVNLLDLPILKRIINEINEEIASSDTLLKDKIDRIVYIFESQAAALNIELALKKH